jgi:quercetin dioxygenase-like cupin family protein
VLSGTVTLDDGEREVKAQSGDYLYVPPGGLHGFQNNTDEARAAHGPRLSSTSFGPTES